MLTYLHFQKIKKNHVSAKNKNKLALVHIEDAS